MTTTWEDYRDSMGDEDEDYGCPGHEPGPVEPAGLSVYCDGTCVTLP